MTPGVLAGRLNQESRSLVERLRLWTPARWAAAAPACPGRRAGTRADLVRHLAQAFADQAAALDGGPRRALPVLAGDPAADLSLPDQLAVTADDLVRAGPDDDGARRALAHLLTHRGDLLGDQVPDGLVALLGCRDEAGLRRLGAAVCAEAG